MFVCKSRYIYVYICGALLQEGMYTGLWTSTGMPHIKEEVGVAGMLSLTHLVFSYTSLLFWFIECFFWLACYQSMLPMDINRRHANLQDRCWLDWCWLQVRIELYFMSSMPDCDLCFAPTVPLSWSSTLKVCLWRRGAVLSRDWR